MRNRNDLKTVQFTQFAGIQLDMEQVVQDPAWVMASRNLDLTNEEQFDQAMVNYIMYYLSNEQLLTRVPTATGPTELYGINATGPNAARRKAESVRTELAQELRAVDELQAKDAWNQHGFYIREDWQVAISMKETQLGYWEWVRHCIEAAVESGVAANQG